MVTSPLSFSATENLRKKLITKNLQPYFVKDSKAPNSNPQDVGTKETEWIEIPLVNQEDLAELGLFPQVKLNVLNQYGPENGRGPTAIFKNLGTKTNEGEFEYQTDNTSKFKESENKQKELLVLNRFAPQQGWDDSASEFENEIIQTTIRDEYVSESLKPNLYRPSSYSPGQIYVQKDPIGSDGALSQDSVLAQLSAKKLKQLFEDSVAFEIEQETYGRANLLLAASDPYLATKLASGRAPLIEPNWNVTTPTSVLGRATDFLSRITGVYSPYSYIPGDYFNPPKQQSLINQTINSIAGLFGFPNVLPTRRTSSDIFLNYTGAGTRNLLYKNLSLNRFAPDYRANFINQLGLTAPKGNYYIGSRTSEPLDIVSPSGQVPVNEFGVEVETNVYGPSVLGKLYESDVNFNFGLNLTPTINGGGLQGGFTWVSPKYKGNVGFNVGQGGDPKNADPNFQPLNAQYSRSESTQYAFKKGSILDDTQRLINSQPGGGKRLQHVGNAIDQVSKVFNDGYKEITKGSRVIKYTDQNGKFVGSEYGRVFAKDIPYYQNGKLLKTEGNIRKNDFSILNKTYNLNMYPTTGSDSTSIVGGQVKKYMLSIENLAWRTSRRPGLSYSDLPDNEKGPNGGRIMWFPPYDLNFSDDTTVTWDANVFLGRPEKIYTYQSTERGGSLSFKMIVDHPSVMNMVVNQVLSNTNSNQLADQILESFFAGLTKFDLYELAKKYPSFSPTELQRTQDIINNSANPEKIQNTIDANLPKGGDGAGGNMESNSSVGLQNYKPQLQAFVGNTQFYFDYNQTGGNSYTTALTAYKDSPSYNTITTPQQLQIDNTSASLQNLTDQIKSILESNPNVTINITLKSNSSYNEDSDIKSSRNDCIEQSIITAVGKNARLTFTKIKGNDNEELLSGYKCDNAVLDSENYLPGPVACRRVIIQAIAEKNLPNINNPNGSTQTEPPTVTSKIGNSTTLLKQLNSFNTVLGTNTVDSVSKKALRSLLNESHYFEFLKETNPFVYDSLREKLKYFHPAFHSMTPEGLNERMTFLMQCGRPGDTIPTKQADGSFVDKDARNTSFGAPPVCIIRIGDFYHTKAIISSVKFTYGENTPLDLNPEGIGVQPMIVGVSISFNFIGGQSLRGPIEELQNALSFNFFANTEMYDERATVLDVSAYDKQFQENTQPTGDSARNDKLDLSNEAGDFIGKLKGKLTVDNTTGTNDYSNVVDNLLKSMEELYEGTINKLNQVFEQYNYTILQTYTKNRQYGSGTLDGTTIKIYGKSTDYQTEIESYFDTLLNDVQSTTPQLSLFLQLPSNETYKDVFKKNLQKVINDKRSTYLNNIDNITNELSQTQLGFVRIIDKLNFVKNNIDGIIDKSEESKIFTCQSASTITSLITDTKKIAESTNKIIDSLNGNDIIYTGTTSPISNIVGTSAQYGNFENNIDAIFATIFTKELTTARDLFIKSVIGSLSSQAAFKNQIEKNFGNYFSEKDIKEIKTHGENQFKNVKSQYGKFSKILPSDWNELKKKDRPNSLLLQVPQNSDQQSKLRELYSGVNSTGDAFNLKFTF